MAKTKAVINRRITCGACEVIHTVYSSEAGIYCAIQPRVSIGLGISRWLMRPCLTRTAEDASAASVASLSPHDQSITMLLGAFSWICGAPGSVAFLASTTTGSGSQSH